MSVPTARPASRSFLAACVLSVSCGLSLQAWAVDTDQDGLPDDWEIAHGRDPARPDYLIASNSYPYGGNSTRTDSCSIINGAVNCTWGVGGGIPGTLPFSSGVSPADAYGVDLSNANVVLYRGYSGNSYKNSWSIYIYPPSVANVANPFTVRTLPTSFSSTKNFSIQCFDSHFGLVSRDVTSTLACSVSSSKQMTCTQSTPYCTAPTTRYVTINYSTKGTIAHVAGTPTVACAMTEYGPECFGSGNPFTGTYDPDGDSVSGVNDNCPLVANAAQTDTDGDSAGDDCDAFPLNAAESVDADTDGIGDNADNCRDVSNVDQLDTDGDTQGNACDTDDDNDGLPDVMDPLPLQAKFNLDSTYKGSAVAEQVAPQ